MLSAEKNFPWTHETDFENIRERRKFIRSDNMLQFSTPIFCVKLCCPIYISTPPKGDRTEVAPEGERERKILSAPRMRWFRVVRFTYAVVSRRPFLFLALLRLFYFFVFLAFVSHVCGGFVSSTSCVRTFHLFFPLLSKHLARFPRQISGFSRFGNPVFRR